MYNSRRRERLDDETLIREARRGDAGAFEELVRRYQEAAFRAAYLVLRDADEAQDAAQDAVVKAYRALVQGEGTLVERPRRGGVELPSPC